MNFTESIRMAFASILAHRLRSFLTLFSMAIGVFAIVGVGSAIDVLNTTLNQQLSSIGRNDFIVEQKFEQAGGMQVRSMMPITIRQALAFRERMTGGGTVGMQVGVGPTTLSYGTEETDPNVSVIAADEHYLMFDDRTLRSGRNITDADVERGDDVVLLGSDVSDRLDVGSGGVGDVVEIGTHPFRVIGILDAKGGAMGMSRDNLVVIPISVARKYFPVAERQSVSILVRTEPEVLTKQADRAIGIMRAIRRLSIYQENDFEVTTHEDIEESIGGFTRYITFFGAFCGIVALLAAGIGVMNIMLVSVRERTREIGVRKAVGATRSALVGQFLVEALTLCQLGALLGVVAGLLAGLLLGLALDAAPPTSIDSVLLSVGICTLIGIVFGSYPAWKAASLDPIESLRYE